MEGRRSGPDALQCPGPAEAFFVFPPLDNQGCLSTTSTFSAPVPLFMFQFYILGEVLLCVDELRSIRAKRVLTSLRRWGYTSARGEPGVCLGAPGPPGPPAKRSSGQPRRSGARVAPGRILLLTPATSDDDKTPPASMYMVGAQVHRMLAPPLLLPLAAPAPPPHAAARPRGLSPIASGTSIFAKDAP